MEECGPGYLFDVWFKVEVGVKKDAVITDESEWREGTVVKIEAMVAFW